MARFFRPETAAPILVDHQFSTMQFIKTLDLDLVRGNTLRRALRRGW